MCISSSSFFIGMPYRKSKKGGGRCHNQRWDESSLLSRGWRNNAMLSSKVRLFTLERRVPLATPYAHPNNSLPFWHRTNDYIKAITNNEVAKAADIPTKNLVVRFSEAWVVVVDRFHVYFYFSRCFCAILMSSFLDRVLYLLRIICSLMMHVIFGDIICRRVLLFIAHVLICNNTHWVASMDFLCLRGTRTTVSGYRTSRTKMRKNLSISNDEVTKYYMVWMYPWPCRMSNYLRRIWTWRPLYRVQKVSGINDKLIDIIYPGRSIKLHTYLVLQLYW